MGNPDILICSVGTEIFFEKPGADGAEPQPDKKWTQLLDQGWNRQAALNAAAQLSELAPQVVTSTPQSEMILQCNYASELLVSRSLPWSLHILFLVQQKHKMRHIW